MTSTFDEYSGYKLPKELKIYPKLSFTKGKVCSVLFKAYKAMSLEDQCDRYLYPSDIIPGSEDDEMLLKSFLSMLGLKGFEQFVNEVDGDDRVFQFLLDMYYYSPYTFGHVVRVAALTEAFLGFAPTYLEKTVIGTGSLI